MAKSFDAFISHTSRDRPGVRRLAEALRSAGLAVWLDEWELVAGSPWQEALEVAIASSSAVLVVIGADGLGPWQQTEVAAALQYAVHDRRPVIPVLLPGSRPAKLPLFLSSITSVGMSAGRLLKVRLKCIRSLVAPQQPAWNSRVRLSR